MLAPYINAIVQHLSQNYSGRIYPIILRDIRGELRFYLFYTTATIFGRFFFFNVHVLSLLIGFEFKSVSLDIEMSTPAFFLVPFSLSTTFSSICPKLMSVLGGEVCFLAAAEKWILFSKSVFYSISSYWGIEIFNIVINGQCLLIPVILLLL